MMKIFPTCSKKLRYIQISSCYTSNFCKLKVYPYNGILSLMRVLVTFVSNIFMLGNLVLNTVHRYNFELIKSVARIGEDHV